MENYPGKAGTSFYAYESGTYELYAQVKVGVNLSKKFTFYIKAGETFVLPDSLQIIENGAFQGVPVERVQVPEGTDVRSGAFDNGVTIVRK